MNPDERRRSDRFSGRVALVTGAGSGIGLAICRALAAEGAMVALNDIDGRVAAAAASGLNDELDAEHVLPFIGDVADVGSVRGLVAEISERWGRLDVAVANAGITSFAGFLDEEPDSFRRMLEVNATGAFFTLQAAARVMVAHAIPGRLIVVGSVMGARAVPGLTGYGMTKAALGHLAALAAVELGPSGITVNAVAPGATLTERTVAEVADYENAWVSVTPTGRAATPEDVAAAVVFLASPEARHVSGQTLAVDGGWSHRGSHPSSY